MRGWHRLTGKRSSAVHKHSICFRTRECEEERVGLGAVMAFLACVTFYALLLLLAVYVISWWLPHGMPEWPG